MKLCLVVPIWRRPSLTALCLDWYRRLRVPGVAIEIVVVGSEGNASRQLAAAAGGGCHYIEASNELLDRKYDVGFQRAASLRPDAVALVGSDDFLSAEYFAWATAVIAAGVDLAGMLDFYLVDVAGRRILRWAGYQGERRGEPLGAGRVFSRRILDAVDWRPHWGAAGYEGSSHDDERCLARVRDAGGRIETVRMDGFHFWAVKSEAEDPPPLNPMRAFEAAASAGGGNLYEVTHQAWGAFRAQLPELAPIHWTANIYDSRIGAGTKVGAYAEIGGAVIGALCKIQSHAFICPGVTIEDEVFIGPHACFTNDRWPSAVGEWRREETIVRRGASIGAGAVILPGVEIGEGAMVGAGSVVASDVAPGAVVRGNPAC